MENSSCVVALSYLSPAPLDTGAGWKVEFQVLMLGVSVRCLIVFFGDGGGAAICSQALLESAVLDAQYGFPLSRE
jgi:hypothetical protein